MPYTYLIKRFDVSQDPNVLCFDRFLNQQGKHAFAVRDISCVVYERIEGLFGSLNIKDRFATTAAGRVLTMKKGFFDIMFYTTKLKITEIKLNSDGICYKYDGFFKALFIKVITSQSCEFKDSKHL